MARQEAVPALLQELGTLLRDHLPAGTRAWSFGSRLHGTAAPFSEVDVAVLPPRPMPSDWLVGARLALEESTFPYVVDLAQTDAAFRERVMREGVLLPLE